MLSNPLYKQVWQQMDQVNQAINPQQLTPEQQQDQNDRMEFLQTDIGKQANQVFENQYIEWRQKKMNPMLANQDQRISAIEQQNAQIIELLQAQQQQQPVQQQSNNNNQNNKKGGNNGNTN